MLLLNILKNIGSRVKLRVCLNVKRFSSTNYDVSTDLGEDKEYEALTQRYLGLSEEHSCFIIHPYVKWGPQKLVETNPDKQLEEAVSLIRTLSSWKLVGSTKVSLDTLDKKQVFGSGNLEKLKQKVRQDKNITAVFINVGSLKPTQLEVLVKVFKVPVFDRYNIVIHILKLHATSKHAKLQVALAEIPYLRTRIQRFDTHFMSTSDMDTKKLMLKNRENKIKHELKKLRSQRQLLRSNRNQTEHPVIAVVGYTNSGKTSLIKALTGDKKLRPEDKLFATLDVTVHAGLLPSTLKVLYVDTVGFISDIPTNLIECFVATLEDAMFADIILHVEDISSDNLLYQRKHVLETLQHLAEQTDVKEIMSKVITVGNKCDMVKDLDVSEAVSVSAKDGTGVDGLRKLLERAVLNVTARKIVSVRIPIGGDEIRWLYKNSTVVSAEQETNTEVQTVKVIITEPNLQKFKHHFLKKM